MSQDQKLPGTIADANARLSQFLSRWPVVPKGSGSSLKDLVENLEEVFSVVDAVGNTVGRQSLRSNNHSAEDQIAVGDYFVNLNRFRQFVVDLQPVLEERRDQLAREGSHLRDAKAWSNTLNMIR
jgi:hypothetical protein